MDFPMEIRCPLCHKALNGKLYRDSTRWRLEVLNQSEHIHEVCGCPRDPWERHVHIGIGRRNEGRSALGDGLVTYYDLGAHKRGTDYDSLRSVTLTCRGCQRPFLLTDALKWGRVRAKS